MTRAERPYHHGDLRAALIAAAQAILAEHGAAGLTLRACARRIGVSHAAPKHHFTDKPALMTAVAAQGYREMAATMDRHRAAASDTPTARLRALGLGYIAFALHNPGSFRLMFGDEAIAHDDPELAAAADAAFARLRDAAAEAARARGADADSATAVRARMQAWTAVHGFATLWLTGALTRTFGVPGDIEGALAAAETFLADVHAVAPPAAETPADSGGAA